MSSQRANSRKAHRSSKSGRQQKEQISAQSCYIPEPVSYTYEELDRPFENLPPISPVLPDYCINTSFNDNTFFNFDDMRNRRNAEEHHQDTPPQDETHHQPEEHHQDTPPQARRKSSTSRRKKYLVDIQGP